MKIRHPWLVVALVVLFLVGCGGGDSSGKESREESGAEIEGRVDTGDILSAIQMNLEGAQGLMVTGGDGNTVATASLSSRDFDADKIVALLPRQDFDAYTLTPGGPLTRNLEPDTLYKAMENGTLEKVNPKGLDGEELPPGTLRPHIVLELTDRFVSIGFTLQDERGEFYDASFLTEIATGRAYAEPPDEPGPLSLNTFGRSRKVATDRFGNIYMEGYLNDGVAFQRTGIYRIDVTDFGSRDVVEAKLITGTDNVGGAGSFWEVAYDGRFVAYGGNTAEGIPVDRIRAISNAGFDNVDIQVGNRMLRGADGEIYVFYQASSLFSEENRLFWLTVSESDPITSELIEMGRDEGVPPILIPYANKRVVVAGRLIVPNTNEVSPYEFRPREGYSRPVAELKGIFSGIRRYAATDRFLFFFADTTEKAPGGAGRGVIVRWDGSTGAIVRPKVPASLELVEFEVLSDNQLWVRTVERATDDTVIGELALNGTFTETARVQGGQALILLRAISPTQFIAVDGMAGDWSDELIRGTGSGDIEALGTVANQNTLKLLIKTERTVDAGVDLEISDGQVDHMISYYPPESIFKYENSLGESQENLADGWLNATGADGFEFAIPLATFDADATSLFITATLLDEKGSQSPEESITANYTLP